MRRSLRAPPPDKGFYHSLDVARIAGVTLRQLQWWDERHVVSPATDGHKRLYVPQQVLEISLIAELRRKGFSLQKIRRVLRCLKKELAKRLSEGINGNSEMHLLTDGKSVYLEEGPDGIIDLLKDARQPMFLVCVSDQVRRIGSGQRKPPKSERAAGIQRESEVV